MMHLNNIYQKIAKEYGISVAEVRREMQAAIDSAYKSDRKSQTAKNAQEGILYNEDIPTVEEFIEALSYEIKQRAQTKRY